MSEASAGDVNGDGFSDVVVGVYHLINRQPGEGGALLYEGSPAGLQDLPAWSAESDLASATFGKSVATAGDVNGDSFSDVIIGAPGYNDGPTSQGRAYVYEGSATGLAAEASWIAKSNRSNSVFGFSGLPRGT